MINLLCISSELLRAPAYICVCVSFYGCADVYISKYYSLNAFHTHTWQVFLKICTYLFKKQNDRERKGEKEGLGSSRHWFTLQTSISATSGLGWDQEPVSASLLLTEVGGGFSLDHAGIPLSIIFFTLDHYVGSKN